MSFIEIYIIKLVRQIFLYVKSLTQEGASIREMHEMGGSNYMKKNIPVSIS